METKKENNFLDVACPTCNHVPQGEKHLCDIAKEWNIQAELLMNALVPHNNKEEWIETFSILAMKLGGGNGTKDEFKERLNKYITTLLHSQKQSIMDMCDEGMKEIKVCDDQQSFPICSNCEMGYSQCLWAREDQRHNQALSDLKERINKL